MNDSIFYLLNGLAFQYSWLDSFVWFLAEPFIYIMMAFGGLFVIIHYKIFNPKSFIDLIHTKKWEIFMIPISVVIAWGMSYLLKILIHSNRPFIELQNITTLLNETGYAFPSSHSTAIAALAFAVFFKNKHLGYVFIVAMILIGLARVIAGVHFPVDILGGFVLGFIVAFFTKTL